MSGARQTWLVAMREMRERSRSRAFRASLVLMILIVVGVIVLPSLLGNGSTTKDVGLVGPEDTELARVIRQQSRIVGDKARIHHYETLAIGEAAVRKGTLDVLVVDMHRLEWRRQADEKLRAVVTGAIQLVSLRDRAGAAGISAATLGRITAPVPIENIELGSVAGRSPDDETAAFAMTVLLFLTISTYGSLVLTGVVEEKASRVVEVLLARIPARNLLAGKVTGIGLLGLGQIGATALAALVVLRTTDSVDIPAARGAVIAWVVVWFVLGYALYAMTYGALGSLASRTEDAQSVAGPVMVLMVAAYFASFAAVGSPDSGWARLLSYFPATAPLAMPNRIAMGATSWWEPVLAASLTIAAIVALVEFGGRVYARAILHTGPTLKLRDVWRGAVHGADSPEVGAPATRGRRHKLVRTHDIPPEEAT